MSGCDIIVTLPRIKFSPLGGEARLLGQSVMNMNTLFGYFQLAALAVLLLIFVGRSLYLRFARNINPFALGVGKRGLRFVVEVGFLALFALWATEILAVSLKLDWRVF